MLLIFMTVEKEICTVDSYIHEFAISFGYIASSIVYRKRWIYILKEIKYFANKNTINLIIYLNFYKKNIMCV